MENLGGKDDLWWLEWVVSREVDVEEEDATLERAVARACYEENTYISMSSIAKQQQQSKKKKGVASFKKKKMVFFIT